MIEHVLIGTAVLLLLSVIASKASAQLGIPSLLLFLFIGMLAGSEGLGGIYFDDAQVAQFVGVVALTFILFAGGLDTNWIQIKPVLGRGVILATAGVMLTAILVGGFSILVLGLNYLDGLLLGAIVSSTDAAAVFSLLRSKKTNLKGELKPLLEFESGSNDPMAIFLTVSLTSLILTPSQSIIDMIPMFAQQMALGATMGYLSGKGTIYIVNRINLESNGLYPVLTIAMVLLIYGSTVILGGNGFLAVYIAGITFGNSNVLNKRNTISFHEGLAWLMQITMFIVLGLLVFPSHLIPIAWIGLLISSFLMFIARPVAIFLLLSLSKMSYREKAMISWVGLKGAVPIVLATIPLLAGLSDAETIFNIVFFIVMTSVLLQGSSITFVAKLLGVESPVGPELAQDDI